MPVLLLPEGLAGDEVLPAVPLVLLPVLLAPAAPSCRTQSSFARPVRVSQRLDPVLAPVELLELGLAVLLAPLELLSLGLVVLLPLGLEVEPLVLGLVLMLPLGLVVELPLGLVVELPLGLVEVCAIDRLATPRNAAATAAPITFIFIFLSLQGDWNDCPGRASRHRTR